MHLLAGLLSFRFIHLGDRLDMRGGVEVYIHTYRDVELEIEREEGKGGYC